jgi:hypothetical protein
MEDLVLVRLQQYIVSKLDGEISKPNTSKVLVLIMEYIENQVKNIDLVSDEKAFLAMKWLKTLIPALTDEEIQLASQFVHRLCEACSGMFMINQPSKPIPAPRSLPLVTAPVVAPPAPLKRQKSFWKKSLPIKTCMDSDNVSQASK